MSSMSDSKSVISGRSDLQGNTLGTAGAKSLK